MACMRPDNVHRDPVDYLRFTDEAVRKIFADAGFVELKKTEARGDLLTVVTAAMRMFGRQMPNTHYHVTRKDSLMPSTVVGLFTKLGGGCEIEYETGYEIENVRTIV